MDNNAYGQYLIDLVSRVRRDATPASK